MKLGKIELNPRRDIRRQLLDIVMKGSDYCEARISESEMGTCVYCRSNNGQEIMRASFSEKGEKEMYSMNVFYHSSCIVEYHENPPSNKSESKPKNDSKQTTFNFD